MKKLIFAIFPLVLMLTGCFLVPQHTPLTFEKIENVDVSITPERIPKDDVYTYVVEENINLNLTFKPDFEKFKKYRVSLSFSKYDNNEKKFVYDDYFIVEKENEIVNDENQFYFDENDYKDTDEIIQNYTITPKKVGSYSISIYFNGYERDFEDEITYRNKWRYYWNIREP